MEYRMEIITLFDIQKILHSEFFSPTFASLLKNSEARGAYSPTEVLQRWEKITG
jgi:hypothetical protein